MLSKLEIGGIKSFVDQASIPLSLLTVLSGPNSAGKSTVLQTLLIIKQTVESPPADGSLRLNGDLTKLGTAAIATGTRPSLSLTYDGRTVTVVLGTDSNRDETKLYVESLSVNGTRVEVSKRSGVDLVDFLNSKGLIGDVYDASERWIVMRGLSIVAGVKRVRGLSSEQRAEVDEFVYEYLLRFLSELVTEDVEISGPADRQSRRTALGYLSQGDLVFGIRALRAIESVEREARDKVMLSGTLRESLSSKYAEVVSDVGGILDLVDLEDRLVSFVNQYDAVEFEQVSNSPLITYLSIEDFASSVLYLGPLREQPRLIHDDVVVDDVGAIGPNGSRMVPYLHYFGGRHIKACLPIDPDRGKASPGIASMTLTEAMGIWIRHLGIGQNIVVRQAQPYGLVIGLVVEEGNPAVLLTNVGVGVSQILPILALGLAAMPGQMLIFEQPELHLHPAVQSKLGDFFVALVLSGVQVLVESHSEHLVMRLRLYVSRGIIGPDDVNLMFVSKDEFGSSIERVTMSESGYIDNWPKGFFDEAEKSLSRILARG